MLERRPALSVAAIVVALAVATRLAVVGSASGLAQFDVPVLDSRYYLAAGAHWAAAGLPDRPFFMSPGYTAFVALCARLTGSPQTPPQTLVVALQIAADVVAAAAVALLAGRLFGTLAGLLAGALLALHGTQILFSTRVLDATLGSALVALLLPLLVAVDRAPRARRLAAAGVLLGLLALLRATALAFVPLALIVWSWRWRRDGARRIGARALTFVLAVLLPLAPVLIHNERAPGGGLVLTTSGGVNFLIGNARGSDGRFTSLNELAPTVFRIPAGRFADDPTGDAFERSAAEFAEQRSGRPLSAPEVSSFYAAAARAEIAADPAGWLRRLARKAWLFANAFEIPQVDNVYFLARYLPGWFAPLLSTSRILWGLAGAGLVALFLRRRALATGSIVLFAAAYAGAIVLFFVTDRYRLWLTPVAALAAAAAVDSLVRSLRAGGGAGVMVAAGTAALALLVNVDPALFAPLGERGPVPRFAPSAAYLDFRAQWNNMAARCLERGDVAGALAECSAGLAASPDDPTLRLNRARALLAKAALPATPPAEQRALLAGSLAELAASARAAPGHPLLAEVRFAALERRLALDPDDLATLREVAPLEVRRRDHVGAARHLDRWLALAPSDPEAHSLLGAERIAEGDFEGGVAALRDAVALAPATTRYAYNLGVALIRARRFEEAAATLAPLLPADRERAADSAAAPSYAEALAGAGRREEARALLEAILARAPSNLSALLTLGELERAEGHREATAAVLSRALRINPDSERVKALVAALAK